MASRTVLLVALAFLAVPTGLILFALSFSGGEAAGCRLAYWINENVPDGATLVHSRELSRHWVIAYILPEGPVVLCVVHLDSEVGDRHVKCDADGLARERDWGSVPTPPRDGRLLWSGYECTSFVYDQLPNFRGRVDIRIAEAFVPIDVTRTRQDWTESISFEIK
jgi:hypothetical protein